jgi:hypothetical protein
MCPFPTPAMKGKRPRLHWRDRAVIIVLASRVAAWKNALLIVKPETVLRWLRDIFVLVIIELASRRVVHIAVTRHPSDSWAAQQLREATPFGEGPRFLMCDNDDKYGPQCDRVAVGTGIEVLRTPVAAPRANAWISSSF